MWQVYTVSDIQGGRFVSSRVAAAAAHAAEASTFRPAACWY